MRNVCLLMLAMLAGCKYAQVNTNACHGECARINYLDQCRLFAMDMRLDEHDLVGTGLTTRESQGKYEIVYADEKYVSYKMDEWVYSGGAHGSGKVTVGTISRKTGDKLPLSEFLSKERIVGLKSELKAAALVRLGSLEALQADPEVIDNFYLAKDGLHFVYNEYEIACYAEGAIDLLIVINP